MQRCRENWFQVEGATRTKVQLQPSLLNLKLLNPETTKYISELGGVQPLYVLAQKEFSERQSDRLRVSYQYRTPVKNTSGQARGLYLRTQWATLFTMKRKMGRGRRPPSSSSLSRHKASIISSSSTSGGGVFLSPCSQTQTVMELFKSIEKWWWQFSCSVVSDSSDPLDYSPPGSSVHGILQARILEWVAISFSRVSSQPRNRIQVSCTAGRFFTN